VLRPRNNSGHALGLDRTSGVSRSLCAWHSKCASVSPQLVITQLSKLAEVLNHHFAPAKPWLASPCVRFHASAFAHGPTLQMIPLSSQSANGIRINVVVPVYNKRSLLGRSIGSIVAAAETCGAADIRLVDNGSTDGSLEYLRAAFGEKASVLLLPGRTIGAVRNYGAEFGSAGIISFLDCDCLVPLDFFVRLEQVFRRTGAAGAGRRIVLPPEPTWVEATWDQMHQDGLDGERTWLNSANLAIRRDVFEKARGFDERLVTGEDAELCQRIRAAGGRIIQDQRLAVAHLDNSKTLLAFYRKERWRGLGMLATVSRSNLDKPTAMTLTHLLLLSAAATVGLVAPITLVWRIAIAVGLLLVVPMATVLYRKKSSINRFSLAGAAALYELYYLARINALFLIALRGIRPVIHVETGPRTAALLRERR
jgi:glycosyltransferase involved in cell wall biosynthesis